MIPRLCLLSALLGGCFGITGQQVAPRAKPADYRDHGETSPGSGVIVAAENLGRSVPAAAGMLFAPDHLVIEVGFLGPAGKVQRIDPRHFTLTVNGKQPPLVPDSPGSVAMSMRDSPMNARPSMQASGSIGNAGVILGRRPTGIPDIDARTRGPELPRAPEPENRSGNAPRGGPDLNETLHTAALRDCECKTPVAGLLFFPYAGKLKSIRTLVLRYTPDPTAKPVVLELLP